MHIPDGYLSPSTCAVLYATATPFWYVALARVKRAVHTQLIPLLSVFAAFSFVIMMFNLPLPGGTTGHAVGVGIATVVLGPWAAMLAISIALVIQALFFGDGGITAIGANCFNMGIVGALAAYAFYRALAFRSGLGSARRIIAAGLSGYAAINASALCAAIEFGIQPLLFHDASGAPLYCPYPLSISIPAMMIGHLTFAGLAEFIVGAGVVAYLQRADPALLRQTAPDAPDRDESTFPTVQFPSRRNLWAALATLIVLTPLGILATGSAWGEWSPQELARSPKGLEKLYTLWSAPLARYSPSFIANASLSYFASAVAGVALILAVVYLLKRFPLSQPSSNTFVERTLGSLLKGMAKSADAENLAQRLGFLQRLDPRVKVFGLLSLVAAAASIHRISILTALFLLGFAAALASRIPISALARRVWIPAFTFSGFLAFPAIFVTPGAPLYRLPLLHWTATHQGLTSASLLLLRVETTVTFSALLILTTEWSRVLRALRFFRVPAIAVVVLGMSYRYVFLFIRTALDMFESRQSRLVGVLEGSDRRRVASASVGVLLSRSFQLSSEVHAAMRARGFQGEVHVLDDPAVLSADWCLMAIFLAVAAAAIAIGR